MIFVCSYAVFSRAVYLRGRYRSAFIFNRARAEDKKMAPTRYHWLMVRGQMSEPFSRSLVAVSLRGRYRSAYTNGRKVVDRTTE